MADRVKDEGFALNLKGSLCTLKVDKLRKSPKDRKLLSVGQATLTNRGLTFTGTLDGEDASFDFPANSLYSLTYSTQKFLEFYYGNDYYMLIPDGEEHFTVALPLVMSPQFFGWLFGLGDEVQLMSPPAAVEAYQKQLSRVSALY